MAIIHMGFYREGDKLIEGAYSPLPSQWEEQKAPGYFIYETDHGYCLQERERNGYDDSDFEMLVWNPETKSAKWELFATTRAWCYPCYGSRADATPEVIAAYQVWEAERQAAWIRYNKIKMVNVQRKQNAQDRAIARLFSVDVNQVRKLRNFYQRDFIEGSLYKLLTSNLRSEFRKSLKNQLVQWLEGKGKFDKPFSPKQTQYI